MANLYTGDISTTQAVAVEQVLRVNDGYTGFEAKPLQYRSYSLVYKTPANGGVCIMRFAHNETLVQVAGVTDSGTIYIQLNKRTAPQTSGTNMLTSALRITTTPYTTSTFSNDTLSADDWLYLNLSGKSGTLNYAEITITTKIQ